MAALHDDESSRSLASTKPILPASYASNDMTYSFIAASFLSLSSRRRLTVVTLFITGLIITTIMKREELFWLLTVAAGAKPLLEQGQISAFDFPGLRFGFDRQLKITIFEDLHFGEDLWPDGKSNDPRSIKLMNDVLDWEPTDLAVLNGDLLTCEAAQLSSNYTQYIDRIVQPLVDRDIPWASTYGNHDRSSGCSARALLEREKTYNLGDKKRSWTESSVPGEDDQVGSSNYYIPIYSSGGGNAKLVMLLWFFDSRAGGAFDQTTADGKDVALEDFVAPEVVGWFGATKNAIFNQYGRQIPSLAFVHIPIQASTGLQDLRREGKANAPGIDAEAIGHQANTCDNSGNCFYNSKDSPFMRALVETEGLLAIFSGHDHAVDWCMKWSNDQPLAATDPATGNGLNVCFGRRSGFGGYDKRFAKGARKIVVHEDDIERSVAETWVRLEDGNISGSITLNTTYGADVYPAAPGQNETSFR
ncbi:Metallo-dependent phosphatase [Lophiostoma macrostomum CBS 122681]|uniref:Metallo-dependent phosphatase n=1 Tax=Lophiostoma macrostomum CBS 122681 TaxID=1314788 RepID=A0A6A6TRC1_9PLEO|nr:Metallo-dependent phosphatase [Lophiostoma macrostomum CBS 122681]